MHINLISDHYATLNKINKSFKGIKKFPTTLAPGRSLKLLWPRMFVGIFKVFSHTLFIHVRMMSRMYSFKAAKDGDVAPIKDSMQFCLREGSQASMEGSLQRGKLQE